jgi:hypothetical protein
MKNRGTSRKTYSVTFNFSGDKAAETATALFVQWLDGGMGERFEDYMHDSEAVEMTHDWDDSNPAAYVFHITTKST